ncbi:hypothetical protein [Bradyrhizobium sp. CCBAU 45394]|uniref:hypothetical protein n=1 Tax=Bradyrhizobium sp. CCBAU 45394 TaxID=1325087 RepID=UPI002303F840|nr:hypothetical protein [Bradyrhizobium sp. CCBAU 45394]
MAAEPKPSRRVKGKRRRKPREEIVDYVVEIDGWDWGYAFSLNMERLPIDPYHEFRHLQIKGRLLAPTEPKTDRVEISLLPSPELVEEKRKELTPIALGSLSLGPDGVLGNIGIPWDALTPILQMLIAGRFKFVLMRGTRFRPRSAKLNSLRLETKLTEDDPLPEEGVGGDPAAGLQASPGPEKIDAGVVVRGVGKGRSAAAGWEV